MRMEIEPIEYYKKNVYGIERCYIKDKDQAEAVMSLTKKKTIDDTDMKMLEKMGFKFIQVLP